MIAFPRSVKPVVGDAKLADLEYQAETLREQLASLERRIALRKRILDTE